MAEPLVLVAASGLAREVLGTVEAGDAFDVVGMLDDARPVGELHGGVAVLGTVETARRHPGARFLVCAGKGRTREALVGRLASAGIGADRFATLVDPSVRVPSSCSVGAGSIVLAGAVLTADVTVGRHVVLMPHVTLTHDDDVDDFATLCAATTLGGGVHVGARAYLGMASSVRQGLEVGDDAVLGMGAVLTRDLPPGETWVGVPARELGPGPAGDDGDGDGESHSAEEVRRAW